MYQIPKPAEQSLPQRENLFKAILLPALLFGAFALTRPLTEPYGNIAAMPWWLWIALLALALFNSVVILGMGILAHDAVHRVLFRNSFCNEFVGGLLSALALIPFYANRQFHLTHHSYAHQPDRDPEQVMHNRPFAIALTHGSIVALQLQYRILFGNLLQRFGDRRYRGRVLKDLALMGCAGGFYCVLVPAAGINPLYSELPTLLVLPLVFGYRALSDHYGIPAVQRRGDKTDVVLESEGSAWQSGQLSVRHQISGWVIITNPVIEWLWSHVNYHEVHHKFPWLSHVHLKPTFEATRTDLPYIVARGYGANLLRLARLPYYSAPDQLRRHVSTATDCPTTSANR